MVRALQHLVVSSLIVLLLSGALPGRVQAQEAENVYFVQPGDTLSEIAKESGVTVDRLLTLNGLASADLIWVGLPLVLPAHATAPTVESNPHSRTPVTTSYITRPGDSLTSVATDHATSLAHLVALNHISPATRLYPGQSLTVPAVGIDDLALPAGSDLRLHLVQPGEHLGIIASRYTTKAEQIAELNGLANAGLITPGQRLLIPPPSFDELAKDAPVGPDGFHYHPTPLSETEKWIDVDLSEQRVVAYEGRTPVAEFVVSTGKENTPTVTGTFRIWARTAIQDMTGGNRAGGDFYYLEDVEWVQYFYEDYSFHSAYWHDNFGEPMSRGCVNMRTEDAKWLFDWVGPGGIEPDANGWYISRAADQGTLVVVHD